LSAASVEKSGRQEVVQYRGQIMPLIRVSQFIGGVNETETEPPELIQVVVHSAHGRSVGLVVSAISDIVHETLAVQRSSVSEGILGSAVIQQRVTDLLDLESVIRAADPAFFQPGSN